MIRCIRRFNTMCFAAVFVATTSLVAISSIAAEELHRFSGDEWPSIVESAYRGELDKVSELIAQGADLEAAGPGGWSALLQAAGNGHSKIVRMLLSGGADLYAEDDVGRNALDLAEIRGYPDCAEILKEAGLARITNNEKALLKAICEGNTNEVRAALQSGVDVGLKGYRGQTLLHFAVRGDEENRYSNFAHKMSQDVIRLLLSKGADINAVAADGSTPLLAYIREAVSRSVVATPDPIIVGLLLDSNADPTMAYPDSGRGVLHFRCDGKTMALLLKHGAKLEASSLQAQVRYMRADTLEVILDQELDPKLVKQMPGWLPAKPTDPTRTVRLDLAIARWEATEALFRKRGLIE